MAVSLAVAASCRTMLSLGLLGPVLLSREGRPLPLTVRKTAAVLVLLALGGPAPRARVVAMLWPSLDETTGRRNLRRELARLRELGAEGAVQAEGDHLSLHPDVAVDVAGWSTLPPAQALERWRGVPFDGLDIDDAAPFMDWLATERERLRAGWRAHLSAAAAQAADEGRLTEALARLDELLADDPLQERHHRQAMAWLADAGRRDEALARYARCRVLLQSELGLAPMAETEALAASLRSGSAVPAGVTPGAPYVLAAPAKALPGSVAAAWLPAQLPFVGREAEVARLEQAWRSRGLVLVEGEGGIGKTRLVVDFAAAHGPVAVVRCHSGDAEQPLASVARAIRVLVDATEPAGEQLPAWVRAELARLLPEWGAPPPSLRSEGERVRFADALAIAWQKGIEADFDAVVLDDWHLADAASQALLPRLFAPVGASPAPRGFVVYRPQPGTEAGALLARLRDAGATHLELQPLAPEAVLELLQRLSRAPRPERFASRLLGATGGHPFHLVETLRHLAECGLLMAGTDGVWRTPYDDETEDYRELPVPASVREAVLGRMQRLREPVRRMLDTAALAGEPFDAQLLAPACALSEVEGDLALEQALAARLVQERAEGGFAFVHDLVPQSLLSAMDPPRRRLVHRRLALGAQAAGAEPARIATHFEAGGEPLRALPSRCRAAEAALRLHALDEAVAHWRQARVDGGPDLCGDAALEIGCGLLRAIEMQGRISAAREEAMALLDRVARGEGSVAARVEAIISAAGLLAGNETSALALEWLDRLPTDLSVRQRAAALRVRADALRDRGRIAECEAALHEALALPGLAPDDVGRLHDALTMSALAGGRLHEALAHVEAALQASHAAGDPWGAVRAQVRRAALMAQVGDPAEAEAALQAAAATAGRVGMVGQQRATLFNLCVLYAAQSRPDRVLATAQQCWDLQPPLRQEALRTQLCLAFVEAQVALGELGAAWHWLQGAINDALAIGQIAGLSTTLLAGLELLTLLGETARAETLLSALADAEQARHYLCELRVVRIECALLEGRLDAALTIESEDSTPSEVDRIRARQRIAAAAVLLARGDPAGALAALPADDAAGHNDEQRWRACAVRIGAEDMLGGLQPATRAAAIRALARQGVHAIAQWRLHRALAAADPEHAASLAMRTAALAATLGAHPVQRAAFLQRWG